MCGIDDATVNKADLLPASMELIFQRGQKFGARVRGVEDRVRNV